MGMQLRTVVLACAIGLLGTTVLGAHEGSGTASARALVAHVQQVLETFEGRGFVVLAINLEPTQRQQVLALLKATGITFTPLESNWDWAKKEFGIDGTPAAFLIDRDGRVMFHPEVHDAETRVMLERQVESLISR